jgi:hypothetical protein
MPRFPSPGSSRVEFPGFSGTIKALRLPAAPPAALRFLRLAVPRDHARFAPAAAACRDIGPGVVRPVSPAGKASVETTGSPKFLGNPDSRLHMFSDPGRPRRSRPVRNARVAPAVRTTKAPTTRTISELNSMAFGIAVYASQGRLPFLTQDSLPGAGQALLDGLLPARSHYKVSNHVIFLLIQASWRKPGGPGRFPAQGSHRSGRAHIRASGSSSNPFASPQPS